MFVPHYMTLYLLDVEIILQGDGQTVIHRAVLLVSFHSHNKLFETTKCWQCNIPVSLSPFDPTWLINFPFPATLSSETSSSVSVELLPDDPECLLLSLSFFRKNC